MTIKKYTYQNETKSARQWLLDQRCKVCKNTVNRRLAKGWDFIQALTTIAEPKNDLIGKKIGLLEVKKYLGVIRKKHIYECLCKCGNIKQINFHKLLHNEIDNCGCQEEREMSGYSIFNGFHEIGKTLNKIWYTYTNGAIKRKIDWRLSVKHFIYLIQSNCHYCNANPKKFRNTSFFFSGIDRLNSDNGYNYINCVPCCKQCNFAKKDLEYDKFLELINRIYLKNKDKILINPIVISIDFNKMLAYQKERVNNFLEDFSYLEPANE